MKVKIQVCDADFQGVIPNQWASSFPAGKDGKFGRFDLHFGTDDLSGPNTGSGLRVIREVRHVAAARWSAEPARIYEHNFRAMTLFDSESLPGSHERLGDGAVLLRDFARSEAPALLEEVARIVQVAPFRHLVTPGGYTMSVAMTNCGRVGWVSDRTGYRYAPTDPDTGAPWPGMPEINRYLAGNSSDCCAGRHHHAARSPRPRNRPSNLTASKFRFSVMDRMRTISEKTALAAIIPDQHLRIRIGVVPANLPHA
jgi:2-oxoglutarate-Fe(II)-dependent oxygenase superfamily protein